MKKILWISLGAAILIVLGLTIYILFAKEDKKIDSHYVCNMEAKENDNIKLENIYEFYYINGEIKKYGKQFKVTYKNKSEYEEAYYTKFFNEKNPANEIKEDSNNMIRTYIWSMGLEQDKNDKSIDKYLNDVEKLGYKCEKRS